MLLYYSATKVKKILHLQWLQMILQKWGQQYFSKPEHLTQQQLLVNVNIKHNKADFFNVKAPNPRLLGPWREELSTPYPSLDYVG